MRPLVIVRPEPGASATAEAARGLGLEPLVMPLFAVRPVAWEVPGLGGFDALLLTSANAIRHGGAGLDLLRALPAHCVGEATARAARDFGFEVATVGSGRVDPLLQSLPAGLRLLHLCGVHRREPRAPRQCIRVVPVYRSDEILASDELGEVDGAVVAIHSPRAGSRFSDLADEIALRREGIAVAAISPEAAEAMGSGWQEIVAATEPSDPALLAIAARLCQNDS